MPAHENIGAVKPEIELTWRDGFALAYQVYGEGERDLVYPPGYESNVDRMWDVAAYRSFLESLATLGRLITHDRRGLGCSDRLPPGSAATVEEGRDDLLAVLDAAGSRRATIVAVQEAVFVALLLAATHPARVDRLVLFGATPSYAWSEDLPDGWTEQQWDDELGAWASVENLTGFIEEHARSLAPSLDGDADELRTLGSLLLSTESIGAAVADARQLSGVDMRPVLASVSAPTLVIRRADDAAASPSSGRYLAEHIVDGEYVEVPGADSLPWLGDRGPVVDAIALAMRSESAGR